MARLWNVNAAKNTAIGTYTSNFTRDTRVSDGRGFNARASNVIAFSYIRVTPCARRRPKPAVNLTRGDQPALTIVAAERNRANRELRHSRLSLTHANLYLALDAN